MDNGKEAPKVPFSELGQVDSDFALAKILQDQERAFMMLGFGIHENDSGSTESEEDFMVDDDDDDDEDYNAEHLLEDGYNDENGYNIDGGDQYLLEDENEDSHEQDILEEIVQGGVQDDHQEEHDSQGMDLESDDLSYEELTAIGELVGKESRGLPKDALSNFPSSSYKNNIDGNEGCVICQVDYEEEEALVVLPCKHQYHGDCINKWLQMNKVCPICSKEVSSPADGHEYS